jgi:phosphate starvation-inducible protein PhoH
MKKKKAVKAAASAPLAKSVEPVSKDTSPYVAQREKIDFTLNVRELPWTDKQKEIINLFLDKNTKLMILKGPAGTSKTILSMYLGLQLLNTRKVSDIVLVRSAVESSDSKLGYLPGDINEKVNVYMTPFNEKFTELVTEPQIHRLHKDNRITICPINFARGLHFAVKFVCCDESQNLTIRELQTLFTRMGEFSKMIICGDPDQSDLPSGKSGFNTVYKAFDNEDAKQHGVHCVELTEDHIVRSELCRYVTHVFKGIMPVTNTKELRGPSTQPLHGQSHLVHDEYRPGSAPSAAH